MPEITSFTIKITTNIALTTSQDVHFTYCPPLQGGNLIPWRRESARACLAWRFSKAALIGPGQHSRRAETCHQRQLADRPAFGRTLKARTHPFEADLLHELGDRDAKAGAEVTPQRSGRDPSGLREIVDRQTVVGIGANMVDGALNRARHRERISVRGAGTEYLGEICERKATGNVRRMLPPRDAFATRGAPSAIRVSHFHLGRQHDVHCHRPRTEDRSREIERNDFFRSGVFLPSPCSNRFVTLTALSSRRDKRSLVGEHFYDKGVTSAR